MPRLSVPLASFSWGLRAHPTNDPGSWLAHTESRWCWVTALLFSLGRLGQLSRADFSIILAAHLKLSVLAHRLGGHSTGGRDEGFWNLPWNWSISGEIVLWASRRHLSLFACISPCRCLKGLLPFAFIYSFEMTPPIFNLYQNLEAWYLFCRSVAHPFSLRPLAGGWRAWHLRGVLPSTLVPVTGGQIKVLGYPGKDKSGERLMTGLFLRPQMAAKSLRAF